MAALERVFRTSFIIFYLLGISFSIENDTNVRLLYTTHTDIFLLDTETGVTTNITDGNSRIWYIDYHYTAGYVYWTEMTTGTVSRKKYPLDGSDAEVIMADLKNPTGIAIDTESDHLYLFDTFHYGTLLRADLDGSNRLEILTGLYHPAAIALDTVNTWLYYCGSSLSTKTMISKCKFDGSNQQSIITEDNSGEVFCISLDLIEQRIYWTNYRNGYIKSAKVDGSDVQLITSGLTNPWGIDVHNNDIYFTELKSKLYKQSKSPGSSKILIHSNTSYMVDVKVYQKSIGEGNVKCPDGQSSESGYYPGCTDNRPWKFVVIGVTLGVVSVIILVIGLIYFRNKISKKETQGVLVENDITSRVN